MSWKPFFARTFARRDAPLHFASHAHHPWPDVTLDAQQRYWRDSARLLDDKWSGAMADLRRRTQNHLARLLMLGDPSSIALAASAHEMLLRLLSCLPANRPGRVLTSGAEPDATARQFTRLEQDGLLHINRVAAEPLNSFPERFLAAAGESGHDLIWLSHVFPASGYVVPALEDIVAAVPDTETLVAFDGRHSFMAVPVDLNPIEGRAFYLAEGAPHAMAGEGLCFMHVPPGLERTPRHLGGFAGFSDGAAAARAFDGTGLDPSALYRLNAVLEGLAERGLTVDRMTDYVRRLQILFLDRLREETLSPVHTDQLCVDPRFGGCGRFLAFRTGQAENIVRVLRKLGAVADHEGGSLRIGFGIYHTAQDVDRLIALMRLCSAHLP